MLTVRFLRNSDMFHSGIRCGPAAKLIIIFPAGLVCGLGAV